MSDYLRAEMITLREQLQVLAARVDGLTGSVRDGSPSASMVEKPTPPVLQTPFPREALWRATEQLSQQASERGVRGIVAFSGTYVQEGTREYRWQREKTADDLLAQDVEAVARVLAALGHRQRLALLTAILEEPGTVSELIARVGLRSNGQAYHHLNTLQAAGLIRQGELSRFEFVGHQAGAFLTLLAGVWSMLGTQYGTGTWEEAS